jgi:penicillin-binding protein 1A
MATAYATLAAGGIYSKPLAITRVVFAEGEVDSGARWKPKRKRVISDGVAYEITKVLEQNMFSGTGTTAYFGRPAAGKTGTTDNHADAWFCGYTPNLMSTVWVGHPKAQIPMLNVHGIRVAGGTFPAEIWRKFMEKATQELPAVSWETPSQWAIFTSWDRKYAGGSYDEDDDFDEDYDDGYDDGYDEDEDEEYVPQTQPSPAPAPAAAPSTTPRPQAPAPRPTTTVAPPPPPPPPLEPLPPTDPEQPIP